MAWMSAGRGSRQWVTSHPTARMDLEGHGGQDFRITIATYLGAECPVSRELAQAGLTIAGPTAADAGTPVDVHGFAVSRSTCLPGGSHTACHDTIAAELFDICDEAGLGTRREPRDIFSRVLPTAALVAAPGQGRPAIVPDATMRVAMPVALTGAAQRPSRDRLPLRGLLFDVKTIHAGTGRYGTARARDRQSGAVELRAQDVHPAYLRHAQRLDRQFHPQRSPPVTLTPGPVEQIVLDHTTTRGLVFGGYAEWSWDVEWLLEEAARTAARRDWRRMGMHSEQAAYGILVASYRRRMGVTAAREMARHRWRHSRLVGLTRAQLTAIGREAPLQRIQALRATEHAEHTIEVAQAHFMPAFAG